MAASTARKQTTRSTSRAKGTKSASGSTKRSGSASAAGRKSSAAGRSASGRKSTEASSKVTRIRPSSVSSDKRVGRDIRILVLAVFSMLLLLGNLGLVGYVGDTMSGVLFGVMGLMAYIFPFVLFFGFAFFEANIDNPLITRKMIGLVLLFLFLCAFLQLLTLGFERDIPLADLYRIPSEDRTGGGFLGGIIVYGFGSLFGLIGAYVLTVAGLVIASIILTQRPLVTEFGAKSRKAAHAASEHRKMSREARQERRLAKKAARAHAHYEDDEGEDYVDLDEDYGKDPLSAVTLKKKAKKTAKPAGDVLPDEPKIMQSAAPSFLAKSAVRGRAGEEGTKKTLTPSDLPPSIFDTSGAEKASKNGDALFQMPSFLRGNDAGGKPEKESVSGDTDHFAPERDPFDIEMEPGDESMSKGMHELSEGRTARADEAPELEGGAFGPTDGAFGPAAAAFGSANAAFGAADGAFGSAGAAFGSADGAFSRTGSAFEQPDTFGRGLQAAGSMRGENAHDNFSDDTEDGFDTAEMGAISTPRGGRRAASGQTREASGRESSGGTSGREKRATAEERLDEIDAISTQIAKAAPRKPEYKLPPVSLLTKGKPNRGDSRQHMMDTAAKLQQTLETFGVNVKVVNVSRGPTVTRYELQPEMGVKVSRIVNLQDDIKLNLATSEIRIEAPIPGKAAVGIEVPNKEVAPVMLHDIIDCEEFQNSKAKLPFAVGKDIGGRPIIADIEKMPHLLIAGATGSGKSVCINTLIMSILYGCTPDEVRFLMIDPKVVELKIYDGIPHLLIPVVTDAKKAAGALNWAVQEMTERYNKFAQYPGVRDLRSYNERIKKMNAELDEAEVIPPMPRIIVIVDELADLMMVASSEVEDAICRLAQLARAAGIHIIIATQRPSVNVVTGLIKANMPSRIALAVASGTDSRTIIDMNGAEKLLGKGDMLFYPQGYPKPARVQGGYVSDDDIAKVVDYFTSQAEEVEYNKDVEEQISHTIDSIAKGGPSESDDARDEYFADSGRLIIEKEKASIGMLQRAFKIGFNRAARIMDQLAEAGVVGGEEGTKPRKILMTMEEFEGIL